MVTISNIYFFFIILSIINMIYTETPASCKARCYHNNSDCCILNPNQCVTKCYEEARLCYRDCNNLGLFLQ